MCRHMCHLTLTDLLLRTFQYVCHRSYLFATGSVRDYTDRIGVWFPAGSTNCVDLQGGNPTVNIDPNFVNETTLHQLDLTSYNITALSTDGGASPGSTGGGVWQLFEDVSDSAAACETLPSPLDNDYRDASDQEIGTISGQVKQINWGESAVFNLDRPIFGRLPGGGYAIFDPYLLLQENSLNTPMDDGGGTATLASATKAGNFTIVRKENLDGNYQNDAYYIELKNGQNKSTYKVTDGQLSGEEQGMITCVCFWA